VGVKKCVYVLVLITHLLITLTKGIIFKEKKEVAIGEEQIGS
jgi:hypothetical protein